MNKHEKFIANKYKKQGWKVYRGGAPDLVLIKMKNKKIVDVMFVEVKTKLNDIGTKEQQFYRKVLEFLKAKYKLEVSPLPKARNISVSIDKDLLKRFDEKRSLTNRSSLISSILEEGSKKEVK